MSRTLEIYEIIVQHLLLQSPKSVLEVGHKTSGLAELLINQMKDVKVDFLLLDPEGEVHSDYYSHVYRQQELENQTFDVIVIPETLDELSHEVGYAFLDSFVPYVKQNIIVLATNDVLNQGQWLITDFKDYDVTFFNVINHDEGVTLYKLYPNFMKANEVYKSYETQEIHPLKLTYVLPHKNLTGGLKMLYEQMKSLQKRGHQIQILLKGDDVSAKAAWVEHFIPDEDIVIAPHERYLDYIHDADLIFAGFFNQLEELENDRIPVLYWEQGSEYLYGDIQYLQLEKPIRTMLKNQFSKNIYLASDSQYVADVLKARFHTSAYILPNFIDTNFYYPMKKENDVVTILLVGNPYLAFKGFTKALYVLAILWINGIHFKVAWACQVKPILSELPFEIEFYENLPQTELAALYRRCDILLSCSLYEGCPMPPLEAMASGVAVVTTDCGGVNQYATHLENALISSTRSIQELAMFVKVLIDNPSLRQVLIQNGLKTAQRLNDERGGEILEQVALSIVHDYKLKQEKKLARPKRKKILFMIGTLLGGGAEKVLTNIVKYINKEEFDITVQTVFDQGVYIDEVKKYVNYKTIFKTVAFNQQEAEELIKKYTYLNTLSAREFSKEVIHEEYDVEVAFLEDQSTKIIAYSPNKKARKIAWVHSDLYTDNNAKYLFNNFEEQKYCYSIYDEIICVSETAKEGFIKTFDINQNVSVIYNPIDADDILKKSQESIDEIEINQKFKMVAVGRLIPLKGYERLLKIHQRLIQEGFDYELWIIGEGVQKEQLQQFIIDNRLEESIKLLGFKKNPYKYMKCCDLFICSSYVEGYSSVIAEALVLGIPVISTECSGARELLGNNVYGVVTENNDESLYQGIYQLLSDTIYYSLLKRKCSRFDLKGDIKDIEDLLLKN